MHFNQCTAIVLVLGCAVIATTHAASLSKIDCTKCRLDVYSFKSKDYDCGIARHNNLPVCVVDCAKLYNMIIPIPNLVLDFELDSCVERSTTAPPTTATPKPSTTSAPSSSSSSFTTQAEATIKTTSATTTTTTKLSSPVEATATTTTTPSTTLATVIPEASATTTSI